MKKIVVAVTGASGMPLAVTLLKELAATSQAEVHLIVSDAAKTVLELESGLHIDDLTSNAHAVYTQHEFGAAPASGSWLHDGMIVCPCSMASLGAIANGIGFNLIHRAADVTLKERRKLILVPRETPLNRIHLQNMLAADEAGALIMPPTPGFYSKPETIEDICNHLVGRMLDQLDIEHALVKRWDGI
ncbi:UbiX family flavin prenyltransferase [Halodesulfovibrio sp.]|jgi:4-hydroxy-3-polyprenylbenzoate decarboxylase|uniref:UbiX family flavin prenyltransferase n=1 Tax=Halodesulfovibrio sp. TaxID=1912772 RepID=UPI0025EF80E2|nr:UbiX family flavin prenyltransferase [Halodesulfovibrio sp.]MCT4534703.1 UbiX family flavin prenyltransferase [Halodesulfovibrio sp.]